MLDTKGLCFVVGEWVRCEDNFVSNMVYESQISEQPHIRIRWSLSIIRHRGGLVCQKTTVFLKCKKISLRKKKHEIHFAYSRLDGAFYHWLPKFVAAVDTGTLVFSF
jgi:hypothetical protein